jgi:predicted nucleotidyltransferase
MPRQVSRCQSRSRPALIKLAHYPPSIAVALSDRLNYIQTMRRDEVIARLKAAESEIRSRGAAGLYLFGSVARDEEREDSDIDLFIDPDYERLSFVELFKLEEHLAMLVGGPVELSTRKGLHPLMRPEIARGAIKVFG